MNRQMYLLYHIGGEKTKICIMHCCILINNDLYFKKYYVIISSHKT